MNGERQVVVIGGGLGGLALAIRRAARGDRVTVCERGPRVGGKMNLWQAEGFRFDTGPSLITMPWVFEDLFAAAGSRISEHVELRRLDPLAEQIFADGTRLTYSTHLPTWLDQLAGLDARAPNDFLRFLDLGARLYAASKDTFLTRSMTDRPGRETWRALRRMPIRYGWGNYDRTVRAHFGDPRLRQMFNRYPTYVGSSPYRTPATLALIPYLEFAFGGWYVVGGLYRLVEALATLAARLGVELRTGSEVRAIETAQNRVAGVRLADGERLAADVVVANCDASQVEGLLAAGQSPVNSESRSSAGDLPLGERSLSGVVLLIGLGRRLSELRHHNVYFSADYEREFSDLFEHRRFPSDPTVYVNAPSVSDRSLAPEGGETLFVMANAPALGDLDDWGPDRLRSVRSTIFRRLKASGVPDIEGDVVVETAWTPSSLADAYLAPGGAIYGGHSHGWRRAFLRPPSRVGRPRGLYRVGGSGHPGGGTPTVVLSARIADDQIERHG